MSGTFDRRDRLLTCLVLGGLSAGFLYWYTGPAERQCAELRSKIAALDVAIQELPLRAAEQAMLQRQLDDRRTQRDRWRQGGDCHDRPREYLTSHVPLLIGFQPD